MKGLLKYTLFLVLPITLVVLWLAGVFHERIEAKEVQRESKVVSGVKLGEVKAVDTVSVSFTGSIEASERAEVSTRIMGHVVEVAVKEGDSVKKGQTLVKIDVRDVRSQIKMAKSRLAQAQENLKAAKANYEAVEKTYRRFEKLLQDKAITQHEFDQIKARYEAAKAQLEAAKEGVRLAKEAIKAASTNIDYGVVKAPFDGLVVSKLVDKGDLAKPGYPLVVLERPPFKLRVNLPEKYIGRIKPGDRFKVVVDSVGRELSAKVIEVSPSVNPMSRTFQVKLLIEDKAPLKSGLYAKLLVPKKGATTLLIPKEAVYQRWDFTGVWSVSPEGVLKLRLVRLGNTYGDYVEVLSGLDAGERIVIEGIEKACNGCKVGG